MVTVFVAAVATVTVLAVAAGVVQSHLQEDLYIS